MPAALICTSCGQPIEDTGWRAYPARVEEGFLAGTIEREGSQEPVGGAADLHTGCPPRNHPLEEQPDSNSDS